MSLEPDLRAGAAALGLALSDSQVAKLLQYQTLLDKWGRVYNLTAVRDAREMLTHHLLDSLAVVGPLRRQTGSAAVRLLDVGSGAGLPGRGDRDLLPGDPGRLPGCGGQEGGVRPAGGRHPAVAQPARAASPGGAGAGWL